MGGITRLLLLLWVGVAVSTVVDLRKRIIGGQTCEPHERLYHVKLIPNTGTRDSLCGGSLISDQWILTVAHCWKPEWTIKAVLGVHQGREETVQIRAKPVIFNDKDKNNNYRSHDIMLLKLPDPIPPNQIKPVALPDCENHPTPSPNTGATVQIAGYGATEQGRNYAKLHVPSKDLQCANLEVVDCLWHNPLQKDEPEAHQHMFCGRSTGVDTCPGDSGGGVVYNDKIYGVHSFSGANACTEPSAFMKVCGYMKWIKKTIAKTSDKLKGCLGCG